MPRDTRRRTRKGGSPLSKPPTTNTSNKLRRSRSRVSNYLSKPGTVEYTNKQRIQSETESIREKESKNRQFMFNKELPPTRRTTHKGGAWFSDSKPSASSLVSNARAKAAYNMAHSRSRVANVLSQPGKVVFTNKERIQSELKAKLKTVAAELGISEEDLEEATSSAEEMNTKDAIRSVKSFTQILKQKIKEAAPTGGAVVLTIPVGMAQLLYKAFWVCIAIIAFIWAIFENADPTAAASAALTNSDFSTTSKAYKYIKSTLK